MIADDVRRLLDERSVDTSRVVWTEPSDEPPSVPSHQWAAWATTDDEIVLGGSDHGRFAAYARFGDAVLAAAVLARWATPALEPAPRDRETLRAAAMTVAEQLLGPGPEDADVAAALGSGTAVSAAVVPAGCPLDHIGNASGHVLHLYDTAMSARSLPPTDLNEDRMGFVLNQPLPEACRLERVEPWFGQPGGGLAVVLDRVIAYYVDIGVLAPFRPH